MGSIGEYLWVPPILFALCFHEFSHAWTAYQLGDDTAKNQGRLTLNPLYHLDLWGTLLLLVAHFGWAKPVPVNPNNFRNPGQGMMITALAGPASNILCAIVFALIFRIIFLFSQEISGSLYTIFYYSVLINWALAIFNMIPIPPLDGSKVFMYFSRMELETQMQFERFGPMLLVGLILISVSTPLNLFGIFLWPLSQFFTAFLMPF
ncbi:MAG: hypothetical protein B6244_08775 [Candidatus Cloacimonetes bacterium 4572_55]|nr:MAG: hypothetical protein B6244_08775 [Candidatus Cloacimonetes bacterium 4572_55]